MKGWKQSRHASKPQRHPNIRKKQTKGQTVFPGPKGAFCTDKWVNISERYNNIKCVWVL